MVRPLDYEPKKSASRSIGLVWRFAWLAFGTPLFCFGILLGYAGFAIGWWRMGIFCVFGMIVGTYMIAVAFRGRLP